MSEGPLENKIQAYWPVILACVLVVFAYGSLNERVAATETAQISNRADHDILIALRERVEDIADRLGVPKRQ